MHRLALLVLVCMPLVTACGHGSTAVTSTPSPRASPGPTPLPIDYNARNGSNRAASTVSLAIARLLYADRSYWEVYVKTTPQVLASRVDPTDAESVARASANVTQVDLVMATEASNTIVNFRNAGHDREKAVLQAAVELVQKAFPNTRRVTVAVFYGESHQHASGTYADGKFEYTFLDKL